MGRNFSQRPSQLLLIEDEKLALDFDRCCNISLRIHDLEVEKRRLEAMSLGSVAPMFGKPELKTQKVEEGSF
jgi:hypothetical protein